MLLLASTAHLGYECMDGWSGLVPLVDLDVIITVVNASVIVVAL